MDQFWQKALKVGGVVAIVMFVIWSLWGDIITKFSPLPAEYTLILAGMIITMLFLLASKAMDNRSNQKQNASTSTPHINRSVNMSGGGNSGNIVTGDGNSINSNVQNHYGSGDNVGGDKIINNSVSVSSDNSGNIVTGDGNQINNKA